MLNGVAGKYDFITFLLESSFRHWRTFVISEIERKSLCIVERIKIRILALMMDVDVWLARIARVSALADDLPLNQCVTCFDRNTSRFQVSNHQMCPCFFQADHDMVAGGSFEIVGDGAWYLVRFAIMGFNYKSAGGCQHWGTVTPIILLALPVA